MAVSALKKLRDGAKKMVARGKTYGKKKGRDLASIFVDLSISPTKPGTNTITQVLAPTPNSHNEPLLESNTAPEGEEAAETVDQDDDKENRLRKKSCFAKKAKEPTVISTEISELTSINFVESKVADFERFCKGWEKEVHLTKIGQGSFATVFKMELKIKPGEYSVWKLMPLKPSKGSGSRPRHHQTLVKDAATEVKMLFAMNHMDGFVQFRSAYVVRGTVPDQIGRAHESWAKTLDPSDTWYKTVMNTEYPSKDQLWLLMEMTDAGQDLDSMLRTARMERNSYPVHETLDMFWGIAEALIRGEAQAQFEHRDLHAGNICIKNRDKPLTITSEHGVPRSSKYEVTLIDYTQSRLNLESGEVLATAIDESIFRQIDDDPEAQRQYNVYRTMRDMVKKMKRPEVTLSQMWKEYVPMTNVVWLSHILRDLHGVTQMTSDDQEELAMIKTVLTLGIRLRAGIQEPSKHKSTRKVIWTPLKDE